MKSGYGYLYPYLIINDCISIVIPIFVTDFNYNVARTYFVLFFSYDRTATIFIAHIQTFKKIYILLVYINEMKSFYWFKRTYAELHERALQL